MAEEKADGPIDPAAVAFALGAANDPDMKEDVREYLKRQSELATAQLEDMKREDRVRHWGLRVRHVSDVLKLGFELAVAFIVIAIAVGLGALIWQAAHADGLVIEPFNVPDSMAQRGLDGQVVAAKLLDRLTTMQTETDSTRAASSFANDWTNQITVQIPDTGVSFGQVVRFLDDWLGHQMHLSGELYETSSGIVLTVRTDNDPGLTFAAKADDIDGAVARAAEAVFARAQPYRYAVYLDDRERFAESFAQARELAAQGSRDETAWADNMLAELAGQRGDARQALKFIGDGLKANPDLPNLDASLAGIESALSHEDAVLQYDKKANGLLEGAGAREWNPAAVAPALEFGDGVIEYFKGGYSDVLARNVVTPGTGGSEGIASRGASVALALHDIALAREYLETLGGLRADLDPLNAAPEDFAQGEALLLIASQDWHGALAQLDIAAAAAQKIDRASQGWASPGFFMRTAVLPYEAYAFARLGEFGKAEAILKTLPPDCDICARMHGRIAMLRHDWKGAAYWFAMVSQRAPDIPFADTDWGAMLLAKGDLDGAIAKFASANRKGPHFADPLEMWGEALIARNRSDLALAKFAEASKYAPNWGRLHLKWGEALWWAGDKAGARKQFATAAALDLTPAEKSELQRMSGHG